MGHHQVIAIYGWNLGGADGGQHCRDMEKGFRHDAEPTGHTSSSVGRSRGMGIWDKDKKKTTRGIYKRNREPRTLSVHPSGLFPGLG